MSVVGLHPEQLIDKLEAGTLSDAERAQLDAHLRGCTACRMDLATRADLAQDAPFAFPEQPELMLRALEPQESREPPAKRPSTPAARRSRQRRIALLVVAATLSASGALAALSNRRLSWRVWFRDSAPTVAQSAAPSSGALKGGVRRKALAAVAVAGALATSPELPRTADTSSVPVTAPNVAAPESQLAPADRPTQPNRAIGLASHKQESAAAAGSAGGV
ncbi:MAG TPA: zf-HC2 domain-containing protein, partial [Polyangiaceae bacterium]